MNRKQLAECQISIRRAMSVIKNKDEEWTDADLIEELEVAIEHLIKAGFVMTKDDLISWR